MVNKIRDNANIRLYGDNQEAQEVWRITQPEVDISLAEALRIFNNTRVNLIKDGDYEALERWEREYNIIPNENDSFEDRRNEINVRRRNRPPFTERWLEARIEAQFPFVTATVDWQRLEISLLYMPPLTPEQSRTINDFQRWFRSWAPTNLVKFSKTFTVSPIKHDELTVAGHVFGNRGRTYVPKQEGF